MLSSLKSDARKILTIRSTYIMLLLAFLCSALMSFYFEGYKGNTGSPASTLGPSALEVIVGSSAGFAVIFVSIIAILFMAHEYRYNTIMYTLTSNASRTRALLSKFVVITLFAIVVGLVISAFAVGTYLLGLNLRDATLPAQNFDLADQILKISTYFGGYAALSLFMTAILRNLVGAIAFYFVFPLTIETALGALVLKDNASYLPFTALDTILSVNIGGGKLSPENAMLVALTYVAALGFVAWIQFAKRDIN